MDDETQLVERARAGDPDAWELLYRRAYPRLIAYARRRLPGAQQAEDAVSETMVRAIDLIDGYQPRGPGLQAWFFGIARNVVLEAHRAQARQVATDPVMLTGAGALVDDPATAVVRTEQSRSLVDAFERLSESDQEILELRVLCGLDAEQVGRLTGRRAGAVRTAQSRALARLRIEYEGSST